MTDPDTVQSQPVPTRALRHAAVGVAGGVGAIGLSLLLAGLAFLAGVPSLLPPGAGPVFGASTYALAALVVGTVLGIRRSVAAASVAAVVAAALLGLAYTRSFGNPLVFGPTGMAVSLLVPASAWATQRLDFGSRVAPAVPTLSPAARFALSAMFVWILVEFVARGFLAAVLAPAVGSPVGADMLLVAVAFPAAAWFIARRGRRVGVDPAAWEYRLGPVPLAAGLVGAAVAFAALSVTQRIDAALFGAPPAGVDGLLAVAAGPLWVAAVLLVVNGVVVPVAEELAWRGAIQTALVGRYGAAVGIAVTAVAFALKHVVVDGSLFRLTSLLVLAAVFGVVRHRYGTASSTVVHIGTNFTATALLLFG
jgi:membrane protease YdiL (CAAX protease family)